MKVYGLFFLVIKRDLLTFLLISVHYDLKVKVFLPSYVDFPHEKDFTFEAEVDITVKIVEPVKTIVLNMRDIKINKEKSLFTVVSPLWLSMLLLGTYLAY